MSAVARSLWLELTPACNISCAFCYNPWRAGGKQGHPQTVDVEELKAGIGRLLQHLSFRYVALSGGEPLLYRPLDHLTEWLASRGQQTVLTSNGRLLTETRARDLRRVGLIGVQVSILGATRATHDDLAGRASWTQAVRALVAARASGLSTSATYIVTATNVDELSRLVRVGAALGLERVVVNELQPVGSAAGRLAKLQISPERFESAVCDAQAVADSEGIELLPVRSFSARQGRPSQQHGWHRWSVSPDGYLKLCNHSTKALGPLASFSSAQLRELAGALDGGSLSSFADYVDRCACFNAASNWDEKTSEVHVA